MRPINPLNNNGSIVLRFSLRGQRYNLSTIPGGKYGDRRDMATARAIATQIQNDILAGNFDTTLDRYRLAPNESKRSDVERPKPSDLLSLWDLWVNHLDLPEATKADHYEMIRRMIVKANPGLTDVTWLTTARIAPATYNKRLGYLKSCGRWAVKQGYLEANPYEALRSRTAIPVTVSPFSRSEIEDILSGFLEMFPGWSLFVTFLLATGVRTSEAVGLRWKHVDLERYEITICESMPKDRTGNGYKKVRKATKTGSIRVLAMTAELKVLFKSLATVPHVPEDLVFKTPRGCIIDLGNFREDYWKPVLAAKGIPYRKPYNTRHTMISHAIDQGTPVTGVAYLAGHKDTRMVMERYGHIINIPKLPKVLPDDI